MLPENFMGFHSLSDFSLSKFGLSKFGLSDFFKKLIGKFHFLKKSL